MPIDDLTALEQKMREARKNKELATALTAAQEAGKLEIVVDGTRYYRKTKRGKNWYF